MKKACFVIPYFGKLNNYFQLFLNSCSCNADFDWLIFTDDVYDYQYPKNIRVIYMGFSEMKKFIQQKFPFRIVLERPYKLCDFKPAYGYIFEEYLTDYLFWGHCDTDLLWGCISHFITDDELRSFDKIGILGHCTLYRNTAENNRLFMTTKRCKEVFANPDNCSFDEEFADSINCIFIAAGKQIDMREHQANIFTKSSDFRLTFYNTDHSKYLTESRGKNVFVWDNGVLTRYYKLKNEMKSKEYMYLHLQSRTMQVRLTNNDYFKIIPNAFEDMEVSEITEKTFDQIKIKNFNLHYFRLRSHNLILKIKKMLRGKVERCRHK